MSYAIESLQDMAEAMARNFAALQDLKSRHAYLSTQFDGALKDHLLHGVCRRLDVIRRSLSNIFSSFPPSQTRRLGEADLSNVQINLHAFCINVAGVFDNWAWAFTIHHDLLGSVGGKHGVGFFKKNLFGHLPKGLSCQIDSMRVWHDLYLREYRDALAHGIPLYIPPFVLHGSEIDRYRELEQKKQELLFSREFDRYEEVSAELEAMGSAGNVFLHSFDFGDNYKPVRLHPQVICDCETVVEFGQVFLKHWQGHA